MIAVTIRFVRNLDEELKPSVVDVSSFSSQIIDRGLGQAYRNVVGVNGETKQRTKFRRFLDSNFTSVSDGEFEMLFEIRFDVAKEI